MREVWSRLGAPALGCPVITVGGTNGKGSCVAMLEAMALAAGYRTACYTSPHLLRYNERVRIDGRAVSDEVLCDAFERVEQARGGVALTYFELGTLSALLLFARARPGVCVLEVGLGGRLDAVNLLDADCSVVTSIGLDHTDWLGNDLDSIALEKAGIFRAGRPAVIGQPEAPERLRAQAQLLGARVLQIGREIGIGSRPGGGWTWIGEGGQRLALPMPALRGSFQTHNAAAAVTALRAISGALPVPVAALRDGLLRACLPGRFQVLPGDVTLILDVAHNAEAAEALAGNLRAFKCLGVLRAVIGVLADKRPEDIVAPLAPLVRDWYLTRSSDSRAMSAGGLAERIRPVVSGAGIEVRESVHEALAAARTDSRSGDCVLVCGSFTTVGEALGDMGMNDLAGILPR